MKIENGKLTQVSSADLVNGVFANDTITELADGMFYDMPELKEVFLPMVKKMGSDCFSSNQAYVGNKDAFPNLTTMGSYCFSYNQALSFLKLGKRKLNVKNVDGYLFVITSQKVSKGITIYTGYNFKSMDKSVINKTDCFVAEKDNFTAHGTTVKQAITDFQFKIVAEKLQKDPIQPDTMFTVMYYRTLTGACDLGCRDFMERNGIPYKVEGENTVEVAPISAKDLLPILEKSNAYGVDKFKQLITF